MFPFYVQDRTKFKRYPLWNSTGAETENTEDTGVQAEVDMFMAKGGYQVTYIGSLSVRPSLYLVLHFEMMLQMSMKWAIKQAILWTMQ